jgi:hypothetical protein
MFKHATWPLALVLSVFAAPAWGQAPKAGINPQFIPGEAVVVLAARPRQVLTAPELSMLPREVVSAAGLENMGFDPAEVDQAVAFGGIPEGGVQSGNPPVMGVVLRFAQPYSQAKILAPLRPQMAEQQHNGKKYLVGPEPERLTLAFIDDKTLLIGNEAGVKAMFEGKGDGSIGDLLKQADGGADLDLLISLDPLRGVIALGLAQVPAPPPEFAEFFRVPSLMSALELKLNLRPKQPGAFIVQATDADAAQELEKLLVKGIGLARQQILANLPPADDDAVAEATRKYIERMTKRLLGDFKPARKDARLSFEMAEGAQMSAGTAGFFTALLLPAVQAAREAARRTQAANNLKQVMLALWNYENTHKTFPARAIVDKNGKPLLSWRVAILPYIEQRALYERFKLDQPWDSPHNRELLKMMPQVYQCPKRAPGVTTTYLAITGKGGLFAGTEGARVSAVIDGTSNTIAVIEVNDAKAVEWTKPDDYDFDPERPQAGVGSAWNNGFHAAFVDGSVQFISATIAPKTLKALFTIGGRDEVGKF